VGAHYWDEGLLKLVDVVNSQVELMLVVEVIFEEVARMLVGGSEEVVVVVVNFEVA